MKTVQLDNSIFLYKNNEMFNFFTILEDLEHESCTENMWQISSKTNSDNTDLTNNSEILTVKDTRIFFNSKKQTNMKKNPAFYNLVKSQAELHIKKMKLQSCLNSFAMPLIVNYLETTEQKAHTVKHWTICKDIKALDFVHDESRNSLLHKNTIIICLNNEYSGGEIQFKDRIGNELISLSEGDAIVYPSGIEYLHKFYPVTSGSQYLAIAHF